MLTPTYTTLGSGPLILMLHGLCGGHRAFAPQVESFALRGWRAVAWDMPGYGHSPPIEPYTFKGLAHSCIALIHSLLGAGPERALVLLGHGMGAMVAQEVVARRPDLVSRLILCGAAPAFGRNVNGDLAESWTHRFVTQHTGPLNAGLGMEALAQTLVPQLIGPGALPEGVHLATHCLAQVNPSTYRRALAALPSFDRRAQLAHIAVPTLLLAGECDRVAPPAVLRAMAEAIAGSCYVELPGIGHLHNLEAPDEFDAAVLAFLAR